MFGMLQFWDFFWIWIIVLIAGGTAAYSTFRPSDKDRLRRLEAKVDLLLKSINVNYHPSTSGELSEEVMSLADDAETKLLAIHLYQQQTGASFTEARVTIEDYIARRG